MAWLLLLSFSLNLRKVYTVISLRWTISAYPRDLSVKATRQNILPQDTGMPRVICELREKKARDTVRLERRTRGHFLLSRLSYDGTRITEGSSEYCTDAETFDPESTFTVLQFWCTKRENARANGEASRGGEKEIFSRPSYSLAFRVRLSREFSRIPQRESLFAG